MTDGTQEPDFIKGLTAAELAQELPAPETGKNPATTGDPGESAD
jgi:hypothetical protein